MAGKLLRRSGVAVGLVAEVLGWRADWVFQVGIGFNHFEVDVLHEEWPQCKFIGFEPHPDIAVAARKDYPGMIYECAVSDTVGTATLYVKPHHVDGSSLYPLDEIDHKTREIEVSTVTLDSMFYAMYGQAMLWLDCEGNELKVLRGAEEFIKKIAVVNVEMTGKRPGSQWCHSADVHQWLTAHGFRRQWVHTQRISLGQYDAIYVRPRLFRPEFCCDPVRE